MVWPAAASAERGVEQTIKSAGEPYYSRNRAEEELKTLQEKAEKQKEEFEKLLPQDVESQGGHTLAVLRGQQLDQ